MKLRAPLTTLERAKRVAAQWTEFERQADQLVDQLAEECRPLGYDARCLRRDWAPNTKPAGEVLRLAIRWAETRNAAQYSIPVEDGTTL